MAEHFRFFNSAEGDVREYLASEFAEYFSRFLSDGLYTEDGQAGLKVTPGDGLQVSVAAGYAFVRGYMYHNDAPIAFDLDPADSMLDRIDRVVLRFDEVEREIRLGIKTGTFGSSPSAPALEETATVKELGLAQVYISKGAVSLTAQKITDERLTEACGLVSSLITIPAQEMWDAWNLTLGQIEADWATQTADIDSEWADQAGGISNQWDTIKSAWQAWFDSVQNTLGLRVMIGATEPPELATGDLWLKEV